ncbi:MAG: sulfatase-like hydrolase/transferase [Planctomycetales bacterium]
MSAGALSTGASGPPAVSRHKGVGSGRSRWLDALHVAVLWNLAVAQPLYDRLIRNATYLSDLEFGVSGLLLLAFVLSLGIPLAIVVVEWLASLAHRGVYEWLHVLVVWGLILLLMLPLSRWMVLLIGIAQLGLILFGAVAVTWCYFRWRRVRSVATVATPAILLCPILFLGNSEITGLWRPETAQEIAVERPVPVVLVVLDECCGLSLMSPDRQIDPHRFPHFAELSRCADWFRNATSVHTDTNQAVPAILSGDYPRRETPPLPANLPQNLFSLLTRGGYELAAFEPVSRLAQLTARSAGAEAPCPLAQTLATLGNLGPVFLEQIVPVDFRGDVPRPNAEWFGVLSGRRIDRGRTRGVFRYEWGVQRDQQFEHFLATLNGSSAPSLHFLHLLLPHVPWRYLPSGRAFAADNDRLESLSTDPHTGLGEFWGGDELIVTHSQQRYLLQLEYVDRLLGRLLERLRENGMYDRCLLLVTADHGVAFRANNPRRQTSDENLADILSIPLFVKRPGQQEGGAVDRQAESVDILPTIAEVLRVHLAQPTDGWSLYDATHLERTFKTSINSQQARRQVDLRVIVDSDVPQVIRERFGNSSAPDSLFRIGPATDLLGRRVAELEVAEGGPPVRLELNHFSDWLEDSPEGHVPCYFAGVALDMPEEKPMLLAVGVNGTVQAVTRTYLLPGLRDRWAAMVPESSLSPGKNAIEFFALSRAGDEWRLRPCDAHLPEGQLSP